MRIDRLRLTGFGRFQGRELDLGPGLNILYGPNEAGKSTVQKFMLGMLYGLKKRGQRREYTEDAERYRPWAGGEYRGALEYTLAADGRTYRVERLFDPGRDEVRLYDALTGADLTNRYPQDRRKELLFMEEQTGLSAEAFRSTAWVGQMEVARLESGRELVARVANLQESGREDLSVREALGALEERERAIGTERAATRPYARVLRAMGDRRAELERAEQAREQTLNWEARLTEVRAILSEIDGELQELHRRLGWARLAWAQERLERVMQAERRAQEARTRAAELAAPADGAQPPLALDDRTLARLEALQQQEARLRQTLADLEAEIAPLRPVAEGGTDILNRLDGLDEQLASLRSDPRAAGPTWYSAAAGAGLLLLAAGLLMARMNWMVAILPLVVGVGGLVRFGLAYREAGAHRQSVHALEGDRAALLRTVGVSSPSEVRNRTIKYEQLTARRDAQQVRLEQVRAEIAALPREARREAWQRACSEAEALESAVRSLLGSDSAVALAAEVEQLRSACEGPAPAQDSRTPAQIQEEIRRLEGRRSSLQAQASDLGARVETVLGELADTADLRREIAALQEEKAGYDEELAALRLARETITAVATEMHREFAPRLNQAMGRIVGELTGDRYEAVRIDEELTVRTIDSGGRTVELPALSGGTVDQFYLALRLALLDLLTDGAEPIPLILDDPFVQYDDERARSGLDFLARLSRERQVILFTCHQREVAFARGLSTGARLINLVEAT